MDYVNPLAIKIVSGKELIIQILEAIYTRLVPFIPKISGPKTRLPGAKSVSASENQVKYHEKQTTLSSTG
jgi:hypothetical protein